MRAADLSRARSRRRDGEQHEEWEERRAFNRTAGADAGRAGWYLSEPEEGGLPERCEHARRPFCTFRRSARERCRLTGLGRAAILSPACAARTRSPRDESYASCAARSQLTRARSRAA